MDNNNSIEVRNLSKSFKIKVAKEKKSLIKEKRISKKILNSISFDIKKGEVVGILGRNGAGKSTLLKIIAKIMEPDEGSVTIDGKIATILELGMGFHPDMSGRENIFLKGELYGFTKNELKKKIESIIDYSGIREFIDNPVRTYSSGMSGRLAFSIMTHVDAEIILVDEVLSTGDVAFSAKAMDHFKKMAKSGHTVILVSHNISTIESMCSRAIWIEKGQVKLDGTPAFVCSSYKNAINYSPDILMDLANAGVADSQYKLALIYRDGTGLEKSEKNYCEWIEKSAKNGHTLAQLEYADLLLKNGDLENAIHFYRSAAGKGNNNAKMKIADLMGNKEYQIKNELSIIFKENAKGGNHIDKYRYAMFLLKTSWYNNDKKIAFDEFLDSAELGNTEAMYQIATMYRDGIGTEKNNELMIKYLEKATEHNHVRSIVMLADIYYNGVQAQKDDEKAFSLYLRGAKMGDRACQYKVANMYLDGIGTEIDEKKADVWFSRYNNQELTQYAIWGADSLVNTDTTTSMRLHEIAADQMNLNSIMKVFLVNGTHLDDMIEIANSGNADACWRLGNIYCDGTCVPIDYEKSLYWFEKAANLGHTQSMLKIAEMYKGGTGTNKNVDIAKRWLLKSALLGNIDSINALMVLSSSAKDQATIDKMLELMINHGNCGNSNACWKLGNIFEDGKIVNKDLEKSLFWFDKGAKMGNSSCIKKIKSLRKK